MADASGVRRWDRATPVDEGALRRRLESMGYQVSRYIYPPGTYFQDHTHGIDKIDAVIEGRFELVLEGVSVVLEPGDWVEVPRGAVHSARVLGDESVVSLDAVRG